MGYITAPITLANATDTSRPPLEVEMRVDTGAALICLPASLAADLGLRSDTTRAVVLADGSRADVPYVGPLRVDFEGRYAFAGALVMGDEPLLGVVAMEEMDVVIDPRGQRLAANPAHPDRPGYRA